VNPRIKPKTLERFDMARWMLVCPYCFRHFEHSKVDPAIAEQALRDPYHVVPKPKFTNGETKTCPSCDKEAMYRDFELIYDEDETALGAAGSD
jgi:hypothetical protein